MSQQILTMLDMQDAMNTKVNADWRNQGFAWYRAIWTECAELMDHYGWKWWKKQTPDLDHVKLELVDIWHFGLSIELLSGKELGELSSSIQAQFDEGLNGGEFREQLEAFTLDTLATKAFNTTLFAGLCCNVGMDLNELYRRYVGKNVLNFFRQDNGYQDGSYRKLWSGKEDNEHLSEVLTELNPESETFKEEVYSALEVRYQVSN
jgi:dimeric dUTPase (all-alpha-NTP-PPase superfamily)